MVVVTLVGQLPPPHHGSAQMTLALREALESNGYEVRVVSRPFSSDASEIGSVTVRKLLRFPRFVRDVFRASRASDIVVYFGSNRPGSFLVDGLTLLVIPRRIRVIDYVHTKGYGSLAGRSLFSRWLVRRHLRLFDRIVALSPLLADDLRGLVEESRITLIPNFAEDQRAYRSVNRRTADVLFMSNLLPEKGVREFIQAAHDVASRHDRRFIIAGSTADERFAREIEQLVASGRASTQIDMKGRVEGEARARILLESAVFVFPTKYEYEAQPLAVLEAMSAGLPIVASGIGGVPDIVVDQVNGLVVPPGDVAALVHALDKLLGDEVAQSQMGAASRDAYESHHSAFAFRSAWRATIEQALAEE